MKRKDAKTQIGIKIWDLRAFKHSEPILKLGALLVMVGSIIVLQI